MKNSSTVAKEAVVNAIKGMKSVSLTYTVPSDGAMYVKLYSVVTNHDNSKKRTLSANIMKNGTTIASNSTFIDEWKCGSVTTAKSFEVKTGDRISYSITNLDSESIFTSNSIEALYCPFVN